MAKRIKIRVVRREPLDAEKLATALVELADQLCKRQFPEAQTADTKSSQQGQSAHE